MSNRFCRSKNSEPKWKLKGNSCLNRGSHSVNLLHFEFVTSCVSLTVLLRFDSWSRLQVSAQVAAWWLAFHCVSFRFYLFLRFKLLLQVVSWYTFWKLHLHFRFGVVAALWSRVACVIGLTHALEVVYSFIATFGVFASGSWIAAHWVVACCVFIFGVVFVFLLHFAAFSCRSSCVLQLLKCWLLLSFVALVLDHWCIVLGFVGLSVWISECYENGIMDTWLNELKLDNWIKWLSCIKIGMG